MIVDYLPSPLVAGVRRPNSVADPRDMRDEALATGNVGLIGQLTELTVGHSL